MKRTVTGAVMILALSMTYCKAKKTAAAPVENTMTRQLATATERWPGVTEAELREGHTIYTTKCTRCHGNFEITKFTETKWLHEIDEMAPKAKLTAEEKEKLTRHILSYRQAFAAQTN